MIRSATLLGSSSGRNAGDAALMSGIMDTVDAALAKRISWEIPTIKPEFVRTNYSNQVVPISMMPWNLSLKMLGLPCYRSVMRSDVSLVFDAILFDRALYNPLFNFLSTLALLLPKAKRQGKSLGYFNVGIGPVTTPRGCKMLRDLSDQMDFITVRDQDSYDILCEIGVKNPNILVTADAALNVRPSSEERVADVMRQLGLESAREILAINVNTYLDTWSGAKNSRLTKDDFLKVYSSAVNRVLKEIEVPVLFVVTQHSDAGLTRELQSRIVSPKGQAVLSNLERSHYEIKGVLGKVSLLFAMRLHAMILASSELTPVAGLAYQPKIDHYFRTLGLPERSLSFENFAEESLYQHIISAWQDRHLIRARLQSQIPLLKRQALKAAQLVAAIDKGQDVATAIRNLQKED